MTLEPTEPIIYMGNPLVNDPNINAINQKNPIALYPSLRGMITQKKNLTLGMPIGTQSIPSGMVTGFTPFINGVMSPEHKNTCQGNGGTACSCGGNCGGNKSNLPIPQSIQSLNSSGNIPTLQQLVDGLGKLTLVNRTISKTPTPDPPMALSLGPCYEIIHYLSIASFDEIIQPGQDAFDVWMIIPCPTNWGVAGLNWGIGLPFGDKGDQIVPPPGKDSGPGQSGDPTDRIKINCVDQDGNPDQGVIDQIKSALSKDFDMIKNADQSGGAFDKLKGCGSGPSGLIACLKSQIDNPKIPSITCTNLPGDAAMQTDDKGNITVDMNKASNTLAKDLMHEMMHECGADELDAYIMTMLFYGTQNLTYLGDWVDPKTKKKYSSGIRGMIEAEPHKKDKNGIFGTSFVWNPDTGEVFCFDKFGKDGIGKSIFPPGTVMGH